MRDTFKLPLILAVIRAACGAMLVFVGGRTAPARGASEQRRIVGAVRKLFGAAGKDRIAYERIEDLDAFAVAGGETGSEFLGAAVFGRSAHGYAGEIKLLVAFDADGRLIDFDVVSAQETPGLGAKIARPEFRGGFAGRSFDAAWKIRKDGGDIDAVTSATISSRAAVEAVADAASRFQAVKEWFAAAVGELP